MNISVQLSISRTDDFNTDEVDGQHRSLHVSVLAILLVVAVTLVVKFFNLQVQAVFSSNCYHIVKSLGFRILA